MRPIRQCISCTNTIKRTIATNPRPTVTIRNSLGKKPTPYVHGWAWQQVLLERRLQYLRQSSNDTSNTYDRDWLLLFEHEPVYTLGRGASEEHLTFLTNDDLFFRDDEVIRLSKKYRGEDSARLILRNKLSQATVYESDEQAVTRFIESGGVQNNPIYAPNNTPIYRIERGGEVTYHGPGQLVIYPMLNLRSSVFKQDLHWYLRQIEEVIIQTLRNFDIDSNRDEINTGVWVGMDKIAAVGVSSSRWITTHGCALNVNPNLDAFSKDIITPCGIEERGVTSLSNLLGGDGCPSVDEVANVVVKCFGEVFDVELVEGADIG